MPTDTGTIVIVESVVSMFIEPTLEGPENKEEVALNQMCNHMCRTAMNKIMWKIIYLPTTNYAV